MAPRTLLDRLDIEIGESDGTTIVTALAMLVGVFAAPKNKE